MAKKTGKTRKLPGISRVFSGITRTLEWTLEIVVGHCDRGLPYCCSAGLTLATVVGEPHCCSVVTVNTSNTVQLPTLNSSNPEGGGEPAEQQTFARSAPGRGHMDNQELARPANAAFVRRPPPPWRGRQ